MEDSKLDTLARLIAEINYKQLEMPIVLHFEHFTVRGILVSQKAFAAAMAEHLKEHLPHLEGAAVESAARPDPGQNKFSAVKDIHLSAATLYGHGDGGSVAWWTGPFKGIIAYSLPHKPRKNQPTTSSPDANWNV